MGVAARPAMAITRWVLGAQGAMYVVTGVWPLLHMESFEAVTGPKTDDWLVHTVGLLLAVIGAGLLAALARPTIDRLILWIGAGAALALAAVEIVYVRNGIISRIYLVDAAIELGFAAVLLATLIRTAGRGRPGSV